MIGTPFFFMMALCQLDVGGVGGEELVEGEGGDEVGEDGRERGEVGWGGRSSWQVKLWRGPLQAAHPNGTFCTRLLFFRNIKTQKETGVYISEAVIVTWILFQLS